MWGADDNPKGKTVKHIKLHLIGTGMLPGKTKICLMALKNFNVVVPTFQVKGKRICTPREVRHSCFPVFICKVSSRVNNNHFSKFTIFRRLNRAHQELSFKKNPGKNVFCVQTYGVQKLLILIDRWQVLSYLIRVRLLNQANHAIWQKSWFKSILLTVFPWSLKVNASKEEKRACPFPSLTPRQKKTTKSFCRQRVGFEISRERQGLLLQFRKMAKRWQSSWKTDWNYCGIEFHEFVSMQSEHFRPQSSQVRDVVMRGPAPYKIGWSSVLKVYCSGKEASRKTPRSSLLSIFPGKCRTFKKCIE